MLKPIILTGKTPYKIEYSSMLLKNGLHAYRNPYKLFYADPYEYSRNSLSDPLINSPSSFKKTRVLEEYRFFYSFSKVNVPQAMISFAF